MHEDVQELAVQIVRGLESSVGKLRGAGQAGTYSGRLGKRHVRNGFALLGEPCCWPHGMRVGRNLESRRG
jgi:hypothetical protein